MKLNIVPVKLPMKPIKMEKWGMKQAMTIVNIITPTRHPSPQIFSSPSNSQIFGKIVFGLPRKKARSSSSHAAK